MTDLVIPGLPFRLKSEGRPSGHVPRFISDGIELTAGPRADLFLDPQGTDDPPDAERFVAPIAGNFVLSALVTVNFENTFDSGVLIGYVAESTWFKVCAERDPQGIPRIVSVVTRQGASDDSNGWPLTLPGVYLRVARLGHAFALHASNDGSIWRLIRYFSLGVSDETPIKIGLLAQSPTGPGVTVRFEKIDFSVDQLTDLRNGS